MILRQTEKQGAASHSEWAEVSETGSEAIDDSVEDLC